MISVASGRNIHFMLVIQSIAHNLMKNTTSLQETIFLRTITYKYYLMSGNNETREMGYTKIIIQSTSESFAKQNNITSNEKLYLE